MKIGIPVNLPQLVSALHQQCLGFVFPRGLGTGGHQVFFSGAGTRPHACENQNNAMQNTNNTPKNQRIKTMNPNAQKSSKQTFQTLYQATCLSILLVILCTATACSTTCNRKFGMNEILSRQEDLLSSLERERRVVEIRRKVSGDAALLAAEKHLEAAIKSLRDSNAVLKSSL